MSFFFLFRSVFFLAALDPKAKKNRHAFAPTQRHTRQQREEGLDGLGLGVVHVVPALGPPPREPLCGLGGARERRWGSRGGGGVFCWFRLFRCCCCCSSSSSSRICSAREDGRRRRSRRRCRCRNGSRGGGSSQRRRRGPLGPRRHLLHLHLPPRRLPRLGQLPRNAPRRRPRVEVRVVKPAVARAAVAPPSRPRLCERLGIGFEGRGAPQPRRAGPGALARSGAGPVGPAVRGAMLCPGRGGDGGGGGGGGGGSGREKRGRRRSKAPGQRRRHHRHQSWRGSWSSRKRPGHLRLRLSVGTAVRHALVLPVLLVVGQRMARRRWNVRRRSRRLLLLVRH